VLLTLRGSQQGVTALPELLNLDAASLSRVPIAQLNLLCAQNLADSSTPAASTASETTIKEWAAKVRSETDRHFYRFQQDPAEYENSEAFFRMLMLTVVLAEDFQVHYNPARTAGPGSRPDNDGFFSDPGVVFISGLLGSRREGTCSSMPVVYAAVGRELGYPLKLVTTKGHLFLRWEAAGERINIEATSRGLNSFPDSYYRHWPFEVSPEEEAAEGYLKSLSPPEELAVFLSVRGMCLRELGRYSEAAEAFAAAHKFNPACRSYGLMRDHLRDKRDDSSPQPSTVRKESL
jgi:tetratricopeptide (TPR) repeat protein